MDERDIRGAGMPAPTCGGSRIGAVVARTRRERGLTQDELSRRLGVTKAAVSKWELGQSLPDTALLPAIAAQLGLTIDALFDWREQLDEKGIDAYGAELRERLAREGGPAGAGALAWGRRLAAEHRSCWRLHLRLAAELLGAADGSPARAAASALDPEASRPDGGDAGSDGSGAVRAAARALAMEICEGVAEGCDDARCAFDAKRLLASAKMLDGDAAAAVALLEPLHADCPPDVAQELMSAYELAGKGDRADGLLRSCARERSLRACSLLAIALQRACGADGVRCLVHAVEALDRALDLSAASAPLLPSMHLAAALRSHELGDDDGALLLLGRAADEVEALHAGRVPDSPLGARPGGTGDDPDRDRRALEAMGASMSFASYPWVAAGAICSADVWGGLAQTEEYRTLAARLRETMR